MNLRALVGLAFSYLWQRKLRTFLTVLGVVIGVGALTLLVGFGLGLEKSFGEQMVEDDLMSMIIVFSGDESSIDLGGDDKRDQTPLDRNALAKIREIDGVAEALPDITFVGSLAFGGNAEEALFMSFPPYASTETVRKLLQTGNLFSDPDAAEVVLPEFLHRSLLKDTGLVSLVGKKIKVTYTRDPRYAPRDDEGKPILVGEIDLKVVGVLADTEYEKPRIGLYTVNDRLAVIPAGLGMRLWDEDGIAGLQRSVSAADGPNREYDRVLVRVEKHEKSATIKASLKDLKLSFIYVPDMLATQKFVLFLFTIILGVIGGISLVVASIGIINTLVMSILERTREIGIMRAIGASNGEMMKMVMIEGASIGLIGGLIGFGFSWAIGQVIDFFVSQAFSEQGATEAIRVFDFPPSFFLFTVGFATILSWLSSLYPAWRAVRIDPVEALRRE